MSPSPTAPTPAELDAMERAMGWLRALTRPVFLGLDDIPDDRPLLFIGNHTMYGVIDVPQLYFGLYRHKGIVLRSTAEKAHYAIPGWRELVSRFGAINGSRENVEAELRAGECVLLFPGGAREAFKRQDQRYQLLWGERVGFARIALATGATVVPFAAVGADDVFDIAVPPERLLEGPLGPLLKRVRRDLIPGLPRGQGPAGLPGIRRQYFQFQPAIRAQGDETELNARALRDAVEASVRQGIEGLLAYREADPDADWTGPFVRAVLDRALKGKD